MPVWGMSGCFKMLVHLSVTDRAGNIFLLFFQAGLIIKLT